MYRKSTIEAIAMILTVTMGLCGTGIAQAAAVGASTLPVSTNESAPWTPLTDDQMEQIQGGFAWIPLAAAVLGALIACAIWEGAKHCWDPGTAPQNPQVQSNIQHAGQDIVTFTSTGNSVCGDGNQTVVGNKGTIYNVNNCPVSNVTVNVSIVINIQP